MITNLMYNDEAPWFNDLYGQSQPDMSNFDHWGHFSQIVWKGTKTVGCATVVCSSLSGADGSDIPFTVCNYGPPGMFGTHSIIRNGNQWTPFKEKRETDLDSLGNYANEYGVNISPPEGHAVVAVS
jgi:hypothetical protein